MKKRTWKKSLAVMLGLALGIQAPLMDALPVHQIFAYTERSATINASSLNVRSGAGTGYASVAKLTRGTAVRVVNETTGTDGRQWYQIRFTAGGASKTGYVLGTYVKFPVSYGHDSDFESYLNSQGFPESYKDGLRQLHAQYPNWVFTAQQTGLDWNTVIQNESVLGRNLVHTGSISSYKSLVDGAYNWDNGTWTGFDGSTWVAASEDVIRYYMDPRNFLDEASVFQFLLQQYDGNLHTREGLQSMLNGTFMEGALKTYQGGSSTGGSSSSGNSGGPGGSSSSGGPGVVTGGSGKGSGGVVSGGPGASAGQSGSQSGSGSSSGNSSNSGNGGVSFEAPTGGSSDIKFEAPHASISRHQAPVVTAPNVILGPPTISGGKQNGNAGTGSTGSSGTPGGGAAVIPGNGSAETGAAPGGGAAAMPGGSAGQISGSQGTNPGQASSNAGSSSGQIQTAPGVSGGSQNMGPTGAASSGQESAKYADVIMDAASKSGVNPYVIAAMILQEQGRDGRGNSISGNYGGYTGYYNYFNVGAYASDGMGAVQRGLWYASQSGNYGRPWNSVQASILGGAQFYGTNYVNAGQDTLYLKKYNVQGSNLYKHQYMTNVDGAAAEGQLYAEGFSVAQKKTALQFKIPVYKNMPETPCAKPTVDGSPNNKLRGLGADGFALTPTFNRDTMSYDLIVDHSVSNVVIYANAIDSKASVSGTGNIGLQSGVNEILITVKAENGSERQYRIHIVRQAGGPTYNAGMNNSGSSAVTPGGNNSGNANTGGPGMSGSGNRGPGAGSAGPGGVQNGASGGAQSTPGGSSGSQAPSGGSANSGSGAPAGGGQGISSGSSGSVGTPGGSNVTIIN